MNAETFCTAVLIPCSNSEVNTSVTAEDVCQEVSAFVAAAGTLLAFGINATCSSNRINFSYSLVAFAALRFAGLTGCLDLSLLAASN